MIMASECVQHCSVWTSYTGLMTDAPHMLFEVTMEVLTAPFAFIVGRWYANREHRRIDREHGVVHEDPKPASRQQR